MVRKDHQRKSITAHNNKKHDCDSLPLQVGHNWNDGGVYISSRKEEKKDHTNLNQEVAASGINVLF